MNWKVRQQSSDELIVELGPQRARLQALSDDSRGPGRILRIELARSDGSFCDEATFTVAHRDRHAATVDGGLRLPSESEAEPGLPHLAGDYRSAALFGSDTVALPAQADDLPTLLSHVVVLDGTQIKYDAHSDCGLAATPPSPDRLPPPRHTGAVWALHDRPRVVPPSWGSLPPPESARAEDGWRIEEDGFDLYLLFCDGDHDLLRRQLIALTGRAPLPPRWTFGFWHSRYYPYSEAMVYDVLAEYERREIPLDAFVVDTDWRTGASRGYEINTEYFPDMERFLARCRDRGIKTLFNDHPEPLGHEPLAPELFQYRQENLTRLLDMGLDGWWFDRNWGDIIPGPTAGLETAVWGQKLYHDIIQAHRPSERVALLSMLAPHPASHRYPLHWTGDIRSDWNTLANAVRDSIEEGYQLNGYTGQDIGGHCGFPSPEQYVRWIQWGSVSPTMRIHSGPHNRFREPWRFGEPACAIAADYVRFRYRLLALLYSLAYEHHTTGTPLLRGLELSTFDAPEWARRSQFMLGDALLFAPVTTPATEREHPRYPFEFSTPIRRRIWRARTDANSGGPLGGARGDEVPTSQPDETGYDTSIRFDAINSSELQMRWGNGFYVVWDGSFTVGSGGWYRVALRGNGRKGLTIDNEQFPHLLRLFDAGYQEAHLWLEQGEHELLCTYEHGPTVIAEVELSIRPITDLEATASVSQRIWIPGGRWRDLWSGSGHEGAGEIRIDAGIARLPAFARLPSIVPLSPVRLRTGPVDAIICDLFADDRPFTCAARIYDDDGESNAYLSGENRQYTVRAARNGDRITLETSEENDAPVPEARVRVHLLPGERVVDVHALDDRASDEKNVDWTVLRNPSARQRTTPLALDDNVAQFRESQSVLVRIPARVDGVTLTVDGT